MAGKTANESCRRNTLMYCNDNYSACARFMVRSECGSDQVPEDLFPNQTDRAKTILGSK